MIGNELEDELGDEVVVLSINEVREHFPTGFTIAEIYDGYGILQDNDDPEMSVLADFRPFLGSLSLRIYSALEYPYYPHCRPLGRFERQRARFLKRRILKLIDRSVYVER